MTITRIFSTAEKPEPFSALGLPFEIIRARVKMAREAVSALDADSFEWLCGPGSIRGEDWVSPEFNDWDRRSPLRVGPTALSELCSAAIAANAAPPATGGGKDGAMERALRIFRALIASGFSPQQEARLLHQNDAIGRAASLVLPARILPTMRFGHGVGQKLGPMVVEERKAMPQLEDPAFLAAYGEAAMQSIERAGISLDGGRLFLSSAIDNAARRHSSTPSAIAANPFFAAASQELSRWARRAMLGDESELPPSAPPAPARRV